MERGQSFTLSWHCPSREPEGLVVLSQAEVQFLPKFTRRSYSCWGKICLLSSCFTNTLDSQETQT